MEMQKVPEAGYKIEGLWISGLQRRLTADNLAFPFKVISSLRKAGQLVKKFKPHAVVGVGGYASGPLVYMAARQGIPAVLQEQNSYAGLTNKMLAGKVQKICVAYPNLEQYFPAEKLVFTGNPVRQDIVDRKGDRAEACRHFGLDPDKPVVLVLGGSLGARTINNSVLKELAVFQKAGAQLLWQCGKFYYEQLQQELAGKKNKEGVKLQAFIREMPLAYAAANVVISRAGALSISELCLAEKPAVLVPSPNVAEDHQTKNAQSLVSESAALLVRDGDAAERLAEVTIDLLKDKELQQSLATNIARLGRPHAARDIANEILSLIR